MKLSTVMIVSGIIFAQQVFAQNDGKTTPVCDTQNSKNNKACEAPKNTTINQTETKIIIKTSQEAEKAPKTIIKAPQEAQKTPQKVEKTPQKVVVKTVSERSNLVLQTQQQLNRLGFNAGPADGLMGKRTIEAVTLFQKRNQIPVDGKITTTLLDRLKKSKS
jgi:hypothetical protein